MPPAALRSGVYTVRPTGDVDLVDAQALERGQGARAR